MLCPYCGLHCKTVDKRNAHIKKCSLSLIPCKTCGVWFTRRETPKRCSRHKKNRDLGMFLQSFPSVLTQLIVNYVITPKIALSIMGNPEQHIIQKPSQIVELFSQDFDLAYIKLVRYAEYTRKQVCDLIRQCEDNEVRPIRVGNLHIRSIDPMYCEIVGAFTDAQFTEFLNQIQHRYRLV